MSVTEREENQEVKLLEGTPTKQELHAQLANWITTQAPSHTLTECSVLPKSDSSI